MNKFKSVTLIALLGGFHSTGHSQLDLTGFLEQGQRPRKQVEQRKSNPVEDFFGQIFGKPKPQNPPSERQGQPHLNSVQNSVGMSTTQPRRGRAMWYLLKDTWEDSDEQDFSRFVYLVGRAADSGKCSTSFGCVRLVAQTFFPEKDPDGLTVRADCADWPQSLRMYFAYKRGLPFAYTAQVMARIPEEAKKDPTLRYNNGNLVRRTMVLPGPSGVADFEVEYNRMVNSVSTATFRIHPIEQGATLSEFYSPAIMRGSIRPGTAIYDANGHVGVVYDISTTGIVRVIDAHHKTMTVGTEKSLGANSSQWAPSAMAHGWGFKNFRPIRIVGVQSNGRHLLGGRVELALNEHIADFSIEQYTGNHPTSKERVYVANNREFGFHDFVRVRMAGRLIVEPVNEFRDLIRGYCQAIRERSNLVEQASKDQIWKKPHPGLLPENIFKPSVVPFAEEWDSYSSPGRDIRLRTLNIEIEAKARHWVTLVNQKSPEVSYRGQNLAKDLASVYNAIAAQCSIQYLNSRNQLVTLTMPQILRRLPNLSFDPYQCPERRWGATGAEAASCLTDSLKDQMHQAQQFLRDATQRVQSLGGILTAEQLRFQSTRVNIVRPNYLLESTMTRFSQ